MKIAALYAVFLFGVASFGSELSEQIRFGAGLWGFICVGFALVPVLADWAQPESERN